MTDFSTALGPLSLKNPVLVAAGTFGYGLEFQEFFDLTQLGGLITKTLTRRPRDGNPAPRVVETPSGMLNAVGLQNIGIEAFAHDKWPELQALKLPVILSIAGFSESEFVELATLAQALQPAAIELNLSCPNVAHGPIGSARCFAQSADDTISVLRAVRRVCKLPIFAKLTPEITDLPSIARAAVEGGADVLTLINTLAGMVIDVDKEAPVLANKTGGLSGPAIRPLTVRCIWEVHRALPSTPILGLGGVASGRDAMELVLAGASAVAVGTATFADPRAPMQVLEDLKQWISKKEMPFHDFIGRAQSPQN